MTEHLQRNPTYGKGKGRPLPAQGAQLANLTIIKLSRKKCPESSGRTCVESMLCKVHPELYIPPSTQPIKNAPDLYHSRGWVCWLEAESSRMVSCGLVGWSELVVWIGGGVVIWWSDLVVGSGRWSVVVFGCGGLIWVNCDLIVWCGGLIDWFHGLIWRCAWGTWSGLTAENWKDRKLS